jgi:hypothetical protein
VDWIQALRLGVSGGVFGLKILGSLQLCQSRQNSNWSLQTLFFVLFVFMGVRGKPRMYYSLLAYCTAPFGRSNFGHQMPLRLPTRSAL